MEPPTRPADASRRRRLRPQRLPRDDAFPPRTQKRESGSDSDCDDASSSTASDTRVVISRVNAGVGSIGDDLTRGLHRSACARVEQMNLFGNRIAAMDGLQRFTGLQELCLSNNQLEELSFHALDPLKLLRVLDLSANRLSSLRGMPLLPWLEELSIAHNSVASLDGLLRPVKLPRLRYLDLRGNQIASPVALVPLQYLKRLTHLRLQSQDGSVANPICELEEYPEALLEVLPSLKEIDEEDVAFLREVSRVRMPKYESLMRRVQSQSGNRSGVDSGSQTTPRKPAVQAVRVFAEAEERVGYAVTTTVAPVVDPGPICRTTNKAKAVIPRDRESSQSEQTPDSHGSTVEAGVQRLILREMSTNTEFDFEKAILERETRILELQAAMLEREKLFLQKETEYFAHERADQEKIRHCEDQLVVALERNSKLENQAIENERKWQDQIEQLEQRHLLQQQDATAHDVQLARYQQELAELKKANEAMASELKAKDTETNRLKEESDRDHLAALAAAQEANARADVLEKKLKESGQRSTILEREMESARVSCETQVTKLTQQLSQQNADHAAQVARTEHLERQLQQMKDSREQYREECLHKDDELYRLKKALTQKSEELEEARVQLMKAAERQDRVQQQQQQLYDKQLQASVMQLELEFRREHQQATEKLQLAHRKYQESVRQHLRLKGSYESSLKREALLKEEVHRLSAIVEGDKQKLVDQELTKRAEYEFKIQRLQDETQALKDELEVAEQKRTTTAALQNQLEDQRQESGRLCEEIKRLEEVVKAWETKEGDWKASLKVKDVMLDDQLRQLEELRHQNRKLEEEYQQDTGEFQAQIEDLEEALDDNLQKVSKLQEKYERAKLALAAREQSAAQDSEKMDDLAKHVELKNAALELIEGEMDRMRDTLSKQDELFQKRLQKHLELHREELERARAVQEEGEVKAREEFEEQRKEMLHKYEALAQDLKDMAGQNTKLRVALDQERKKIAQSDREMRVVLAQLDRERHVKNERLGDIKRLFEQLQQESP